VAAQACVLRWWRCAGGKCADISDGKIIGAIGVSGANSDRM
jgi:uncharacterized protein GlcG (DUF336 family)